MFPMANKFQSLSTSPRWPDVKNSPSTSGELRRKSAARDVPGESKDPYWTDAKSGLDAIQIPNGRACQERACSAAECTAKSGAMVPDP